MTKIIKIWAFLLGFFCGHVSLLHQLKRTIKNKYVAIKIAVVNESINDETRVAVVPEIAQKLSSNNISFVIEKNAGAASGFLDADYPDNSCSFVGSSSDVLNDADVLFKVNPPTPDEIKNMKKGAIAISYMQPFQNDALIKSMAASGIDAFSVELIPRISRAQSMDALSSQASIAGYKSVILAANHANKFFPMLTTAAGTVRPAQTLIIGAGVAGLQAIATAKRLGSRVIAFDVRGSTREQIESLGAQFLDTGITAEGEGGYARELTTDELDTQKEVLSKTMSQSDVVITTAAVPGKPAPKLIDKETVESMAPGSVIVDLGAISGGNCELTKPDEIVDHGGVIILGPTNLPSTMPKHASELYSRNLLNFLSPALTDEGLSIDWDDEIFKGANITRNGEVLFDQEG